MRPSTPCSAPGFASPPIPTPAPAGSLHCWAQSGSHFRGIAQSHATLPAGVYRPDVDSSGIFLTAVELRSDRLLPLPDSASTTVLEDLERFWGKKEVYRSLGYLHKRGVLLWGPPGSGKTSTVTQLASMVVQRGGVVLLVDHPGLALDNLRVLREIEPERPVLLVLEDLDSLVRQHDENDYLSLLDGEAQIDNVVAVATTNYPESLDKRFTDRPGRFALVRYIGMPSAEARRAYLETKLGSETEVEEWVNATNGLPIDHVRELVVLVKCDGLTLREALTTVNQLRLKISSDKAPDANATGFARG